MQHTQEKKSQKKINKNVSFNVMMSVYKFECYLYARIFRILVAISLDFNVKVGAILYFIYFFFVQKKIKRKNLLYSEDNLIYVI